MIITDIPDYIIYVISMFKYYQWSFQTTMVNKIFKEVQNILKRLDAFTMVKKAKKVKLFNPLMKVRLEAALGQFRKLKGGGKGLKTQFGKKHQPMMSEFYSNGKNQSHGKRSRKGHISTGLKTFSA